jgi:hypothetical protein
MIYLITDKAFYKVEYGKITKICDVEGFPYVLGIVRDYRNLKFARKGYAKWTELGLELYDKEGVRVGVIYKDQVKQI